MATYPPITHESSPEDSHRLYHLHLVSDATGESVITVARACLVQFEGIEPVEHTWTLIRTKGQMDKVIAGIAAAPGPVLFTMVNDELRRTLIEACRRSGVPYVDILDPAMHVLASYFGLPISGRPGRQHILDAEYFDRIEAMNFTLAHDDGQLATDLSAADVVLIGVSRTSKTPTCIYLANRGVRAANVPIVPNVPLPDALSTLSGPLIIGLTKDPARLVDLRRHRLRLLSERHNHASYADYEAVKEEVANARRLFSKNKWPVIDVTRRSIEETAASILTLYQNHRQKQKACKP